MIVVVPPKDYLDHASDLLEMHKLRHRAFVQRLDWSVRSVNGLEIDSFDALGPTYFLAFDTNDRLVGTTRLLPTSGPTMLRDVFPQLLDGRTLPASDDVWECSRFASECRAGTNATLGNLNLITAELFAAMVEFCLEEEIIEVVVAYDVLIARLLKRVGCLPRWQGKGHRIENTIAIAGWFDATEELLANIRNLNGIQGSVIHRRRPVVPTPVYPQTELFDYVA